MYIINYKAFIKPDETAQDLIAEICEDCGLQPDERFAFSAIQSNDKVKINRLSANNKNPYTVEQLVYELWNKPMPENNIRYVQPPIEQWLKLFEPLLISMIEKVYPRYEKLIPEREEMKAILYFVIAKLYAKGYYLHKSVIQKAFINQLNMECRTLKGMNITDSLDASIGQDEDGKDITLLDQIPDEESTEWAKRCNSYTDDDYWEDKYEELKAAMLKEMSPLAFERILIQLKTKTVDRKTSYWLNKYREILNPGYTPRPNAKGKPKGGNKQ